MKKIFIFSFILLMLVSCGEDNSLKPETAEMLIKERIVTQYQPQGQQLEAFLRQGCHEESLNSGAKKGCRLASEENMLNNHLEHGNRNTDAYAI